jgi:hypothetical protein
MRDSDRAANAAAKFFPAVSEEDTNGVYADPAIQIAGPMAHVYAQDGIHCVDIEPHEPADPDVYDLYDDGCLPVRVRVGGEVVYEIIAGRERYGSVYPELSGPAGKRDCPAAVCAA